MEAREIQISRAAWLILFGVLLAGCGGGGCSDDCPAPLAEMSTPKMPCAASAVCLK